MAPMSMYHGKFADWDIADISNELQSGISEAILRQQFIAHLTVVNWHSQPCELVQVQWLILPECKVSQEDLPCFLLVTIHEITTSYASRIMGLAHI
jgi:hypothetical protein